MKLFKSLGNFIFADNPADILPPPSLPVLGVVEVAMFEAELQQAIG